MNDSPGREKNLDGQAEDNVSATGSTAAARNHDRLIESIQMYFGNTRAQTDPEADRIAANPPA